MRFRKQLTIGCIIIALLNVAVAVLPWVGDARLGGLGLVTPVKTWIAANIDAVRAGLTIGLAAASGLIALFAAVVFGGRVHDDIRTFRARLRDAAERGHTHVLARYATDEVRVCAEAAATVLETVLARQERLSEDATMDALTGLANRRTLMYTLTRETAVARRTAWPLSLVMVDLDHFKQLNDTYGHQAGDLVLQSAARRLASLVRQSDVVARFGGEEFVVVLPSTDLTQAVEVAQQLRAALRCDLVVHEGRELTVTASFGVAEFHACGAVDADMLMSRADGALYAAKNAGRDMVMAAAVVAPADAIVDESDLAAVEAGPTETATNPNEEADRLVDRDAMALMGSTFSVLQVIPDQHRVAQDVVQQVAATLRCASVALYILGEGDGQLHRLAVTDLRPGANPEVTADLREWFDHLRTSSAYLPERCLEPKIVSGSAEAPDEVGIRLPLVAQGAVFGVIEAQGIEGDGELFPRQRAVLSALSAIGATALRTCRQFARGEAGWITLIETLCRTLHSFDAYKRDHAERVSTTAVAIAKAMGQQNEEALQLLRVAGLVHDIGKVGLPRRLMTKRGKLRAGERRQLAEHCRIGAEILRRVTHFDRLADIVRAHHEHFDGAGYPQGLAGAEIPIESRIIAVADAYDAMTSDRPYRSAMSRSEALARIRGARGTQFDPAVVDALMTVCIDQLARATWDGSLEGDDTVLVLTAGDGAGGAN